MEYGFVYIWKDRKHKRYYVGSHWGTEDDGYICSSHWMLRAYKRRPEDFRRKIISKVYTNKQDLLDIENHYLGMIKEDEIKVRYYNLRIHAFGHWSADKDLSKSVGEKISKALTGKPSKLKGKKLSEETKKKISISTKAGMTKMDKSYRNDEEYRKKISENTKRLQKEGKIGTKGLKYSEESKAKMSKIQKGSNNPMFNVKHSDEAKRKISEASKAMWAKRCAENT